MCFQRVLDRTHFFKQTLVDRFLSGNPLPALHGKAPSLFKSRFRHGDGLNGSPRSEALPYPPPGWCRHDGRHGIIVPCAGWDYPKLRPSPA
jgi:hypothetical protein